MVYVDSSFRRTEAKGDEYLYKTGWVWSPGWEVSEAGKPWLVFPAFFSDRIFRWLPENPEKTNGVE